MRAEQTVSEMVVESLARQAEALSEETERPFGEAFAEILKTHAGSKLAELADGPHRHEKAADWQAGLLIDRKVQRTAYLCASKGGYDAGEVVLLVAWAIHRAGRGHTEMSCGSSTRTA